MRSIWFSFALTFAAFASVIVITPSPSSAQPNPTECVFPIDEPHSDTSGFPSVAHRQDGGFLAAYAIFLRTAPVGEEFERGIFLRRFDAAGNYVGGPSTVLPFQPLNVQGVELERDADGDFIVGWSSSEQGGPDTDVRAQRLDADGMLQGSEILINAGATGFHRQLDLATTGDRVLYVWHSDTLDGDEGGIVGRLGDLDGNLLGNAFAINTYTTGEQSEPTIDVTAGGEFVVAWRGEGVGPGSGEGVFLRTFDTTGAPLIPEARVSSSTGLHSHPSIGHDDDHLLVTWAYRPMAGDNRSVRGQFVDAAASRDGRMEALGTEIAIRSSNFVDAFLPKVASRSGGEFVVVWDDYNPDLYGGNELGARTVTEVDGVGPLFNIGNDCIGCIFRPDLDVSPVGDDFVVVWQNAVTLNRGQIAGQRYDGPVGGLVMDLSLDITEEEDPTDAVTGVTYNLNLENPGPCPATGLQVDVTMPQEVADAGFFWIDDNQPDCSANGGQLTCTGTLFVGLNDNVRIFSQDLPNTDDLLTISGSLTSDATDPNAANDTDVETTQVLRCVQLTLEHSGKGSDPVASPVAPCGLDTFAPGTQVQLTAAQASDGWRISSWSGTDNDASTSRFNTVTMGNFDQDVAVHYELVWGSGGVSWWTADDVLDDVLGPNDLTAIGAADPFNPIGEQGQAFFPDTTPILEAPFDPSLNLGTTFSIGMWVRVQGPGPATRALLDHREQGPSANLGTYAFLSNDRPAMRLGDGQIARNYISPTPIGDDVYHLVVYTFDQGDLRIYIDGVLDSQHDTSAVGSRDNSSRLTLGTQSLGASGALFGRMDEVFITTDVLSEDDIERLFLRPLGLWRGDGNALDSSTYASHGTLAGGAGFTDGRCGQAFDLSTPGSTVTAPGTPGIEVDTYAFTFAAWVRADETAATQRLFQKGVTELSLVDGQLHLETSVSDGTANALGDLRDGRSHYIAVTSRRNGSAVRMNFWVDGQLQEVIDGAGSGVDIGPETMVLGGGEAGPAWMDEVLFLGEVILPDRFEAWRELCLQPFFGDSFEAGDTSAWSSAVP